MTINSQIKDQTEIMTVEMTGNADEERIAQAKDQEILPQLEAAWKAGGMSDMEMFELAHTLGASQELLSKCVGFTGERGAGLPWVSRLIELGYPKAWIRDRIMHHCFHDEMSPCSFQMAFLRDESAWKAFDNPKLLMAFFEALAGAEHMGGDVLRRRDALAFHLGRMRQPELRPIAYLPQYYPRQDDFDRIKQRDQEISVLGLEDANLVAMKAVHQLGHPGDVEVVKVIESLPRSSRIMAANRIILNHLGLPFIARVLVNDVRTRHEGDSIRGRIVQEIDKRPDKACLIYRFLLKGGADQAGGPNRFKMSEYDEVIRHCLHSAGWEFCRLEEHEDSRSGRTSLQAVVPNVRPRLIWSHDSRGLRREVLWAGDEVIVPRRPINGAHAVVNLPHMQVYRVEIHAAAPPTPKMEKTAGQDFLVR